MRRAGVALIAAMLALAGCKNANTKSDDKSPDRVTSRNKKDGKDKKDGRDKDAASKTPWYDLPGSGSGVPKGSSVTDPKDPLFDPKVAAQEVLAGRVQTLEGKPARNIYVRVEQVGAVRSGPSDPGIDTGVYTNNDGFFQAPGKPGKTYELTALATTPDGRKLVGVVQTKVPNPTLLILLRDDLAHPGGASPPKGDGGTFPPEPKPSEKVGDYIPPMGNTPPTPKPVSDGAWKPGAPVTGVPPASIGGAPARPPVGGTPGGALPPPDLSDPPAKPTKPENVADGPKDPFKPPAANIPGGPPVPPLPTLPPSFPNPPAGGRSSMKPTGAAGKLALLDALERPWGLDSVRPGSLVLVEFVSSTCKYCPKAIPILKDLQSRYGGSGLEVAAVLCDDGAPKQRVAAAAKYSRDYDLNYAIYVEQNSAGSVRDSYEVNGYPTAILLDSAGRELWRGNPLGRAELEAAVKKNLGK